MKSIHIFIGIALIIFSSCSKKPDIGGTAAEKMANEWWITFTVDGADIYGIGYTKIKTYNTAANGNEIWIDDFPAINPIRGNTWAFQVKAQADFNALTFSATDAISAVPGYDIAVDVTEGKIIQNGGKSKTGNIADSIHMKIEFEDDPGTIYTIQGHARTRFAEDDY